MLLAVGLGSLALYSTITVLVTVTTLARAEAGHGPGRSWGGAVALFPVPSDRRTR